MSNFELLIVVLGIVDITIKIIILVLLFAFVTEKE